MMVDRDYFSERGSVEPAHITRRVIRRDGEVMASGLRARPPLLAVVGLVSVAFAACSNSGTSYRFDVDGDEGTTGNSGAETENISSSVSTDSSITAFSGSGEASESGFTPVQLAALAACEDATGKRSFDGCPVTVVCDSLDAEDVVRLEVDFEEQLDQCDWHPTKTALDGPDDRDNLKKLDSNTRARIEQVRDLEPLLQVPGDEKAVFCSVDISVTSTRSDGKFRYDDDLLLIFGGYDETSGPEGGALLVTRNRDMPGQMLETVPEFADLEWPLYTWPRIVDVKLSNSDPQLYCLGFGELDADVPGECALPITQQDGDFAIKLDKDTAEAIGIRAALTGNYNLTTVITGDNDASKDCQHDGFRATIDVSYLVLPEGEIQGLI